MVKFRCGCGQKIGVPESYIGHLVRCPRCARAIPVPEEINVPVVPLEQSQPVQEEPLESDANVPSQPSGDQTFSFDIRTEVIAAMGETPPEQPEPVTMRDPFSTTEFSPADWEADNNRSDDLGLSMTGLASMIDEPDESLHLQTGPEFHEHPAAEPPQDDGRGLEELLAVDDSADVPRPGSSQQVTDLLRDLSASNQPLILTEPAPLPQPLREPATVPRERGRSSSRWLAPLAGTFSLLAALAALGLCGFPELARLAVPVASAGILLALAGMIVAPPRKNAAGLPMAGAVLGITAIALALAIACGVAPRIDLRQKGSGRLIRPAMATAMIVPLARAGDVEVRVTSAKVVRPAVYDGKWESLKTDDRRCLQITFALRNTSRRQRIEYRPWGVSRGSEVAPTMADSGGDPLKLVDVSPSIPVGRAVGSTVYLEPGGKGKADVLLFEVPPASAQDLELQLPGANVGVPNTTLHIQIPAEIVKR